MMPKPIKVGGYKPFGCLLIQPLCCLCPKNLINLNQHFWVHTGMPNMGFHSKNVFFDIFRCFFLMKTRLSRKNELGHEQELSMLFPNHPYFLLIGIIWHEWQLACRKVSFEEKIFNFFISRGVLETAWIALAHGLIHFFWKVFFS